MSQRPHHHALPRMEPLGSGSSVERGRPAATPRLEQRRRLDAVVSSLRPRRTLALALLLFGFIMAGRDVIAQTMLDDFEQLSGWTASTSEGATAQIVADAGH